MTIVVAFSADQYGRAALDHGAHLAQKEHQRLVVVNPTKGDRLVEPRYAHEDEVQAIIGQLEDAGIEVDVRRDVVSDLADAVLDVIEQEDADLVVVGVRHRSPVGKALMGSVGQRIILDAPCPVLCVKP